MKIKNLIKYCYFGIICIMFVFLCGCFNFSSGDNQGENPHEHKYTETKVEPTCTEKGYSTFTCECGDFYEGNYVEALGHSVSTKLVYDNTSHWYQCTCEHANDKVNPVDHKYVDGFCTECGVHKETIENLRIEIRYDEEYGQVAYVIDINSKSYEELIIPGEYLGHPVVFNVHISTNQIQQGLYIGSLSFLKGVKRISLLHEEIPSDSLCVFVPNTAEELNLISSENKFIVYYDGNLVEWCENTKKFNIYSNIYIKNGDDEYYRLQDATELIIPEGVESIQSYSFAGLDITDVKLPNSLKMIDSSAFEKCHLLKRIELPTNLEVLSGFNDCGIEELYIPKSVSKVYNIDDCPDLESVVFEEGTNVKIIQTFNYCENLSEVVLVDGIEVIDNGFGSIIFSEENKVKDLVLPASVTTFIGFPSLENIYYEGTISQWFNIDVFIENGPDIRTYIAENIYFKINGEWQKPTTLTIPEDVTYISEGKLKIFSELTSITLPNTVEKFYIANEDVQIEEINYNGTLNEWLEVDCSDKLISETLNVLEEGVMTNVKYVIAPETVDFNNLSITSNSSIDFIYLSNIKESMYINENTVLMLGTKLAPIAEYIGGFTAKIYDEIDINNIVYYDGAIYLLTGGKKATLVRYLNNSSSEEAIEIPKQICVNEQEYAVNVIGTNAFVNRYIYKLTFNNTVETFEDGCLYNMTSLSELTVPFVGNNKGLSDRRLETLFIHNAGGTDWGGFPKLEVLEITNDTNMPYFLVTDEENTIFYYVRTLKLGNVNELTQKHFYDIEELENLYISTYTSYLYKLAKNVYYDGTFEQFLEIEIYDSSNVENFYLKNQSTGEYELVTEITLNQDIPDHKFDGWSKLQKVTLNEGVTKIGDYAFSNTSISTITIPSSLTYIGAYAFSNCNELMTVDTSKAYYLKTIEEYAFYNCYSLSSFDVPSGIYKIGEFAFYETNISKFFISAGEKDIVGYSFVTGNCPVRVYFEDYKENVYFPSSNLVGIEAFYFANPSNYEVINGIEYYRDYYTGEVYLTGISSDTKVLHLETPIYAFGGSVESYSVRKTAFTINSSLEEIYLPSENVSLVIYFEYLPKNFKKIYFMGTKEEFDELEYRIYVSGQNINFEDFVNEYVVFLES